MEGRPPTPEPDATRRAQNALRLGNKEASFAAVYLREVGIAPEFRFSSAKTLKDALRAELDVEDLTASVDPRITGALLELRLPNETSETLGEVRRRLAYLAEAAGHLEALNRLPANTERLDCRTRSSRMR